MRGDATLPLDLSRFRRLAMPGQCLASREFGDSGTVGIIGVDRWTGRTVALTAMHVVPGITEYPSPLHPEPITFECPCANGGAVAGRLVRGTIRGVDAAVIDVEGQAVSNLLPEIGMVEFWRPASRARDRGRAVRMVGAMSPGVQHGTVLDAERPVPALRLDSAILVEMGALHGDSGAPLVDEHGRLLGMLVGGDGAVQVFSPIELVFDRLACQLFRG